MEDVLYDLIIIGSGPAGIICALEYLDKKPNDKVLIIEFGSKPKVVPNSLDDTVIIDSLKNHHSPYECTNKGWGGSSLTWGGRCVSYDPIDFLDREVLRGQNTWDSNFEKTLVKYQLKAAQYFEIANADFDLSKGEDSFLYKPIAENFINENVTDTQIERWSIPTRFGQRYQQQLNEYKNYSQLIGWEVVELISGKDLKTISAIKIKNIDNQYKKLSASKVVIAAGATETTRLLLKNTHIFNAISSVPPSLGHYYQGHVSGKIASVKFYGDPRKTQFGFYKNKQGVYFRQRFQFSKEFLLNNNLLNTAIWLDNPLYHDPKHKNGAMSFMYLAMITPILGKLLAPPVIADSVTKGKINKIGKHIWNIVKDFPKSFLIPVSLFYKRYVRKRKLPGIFLFNPNNEYALHFHAEQIPLYENKMYLDASSNIHISYRYCEEDINSVIKIHEELDRSLRDSNCGELNYWYPKDQLFDEINKMSRDGIHQVGTTRIGKSESEGVVDENLQVFGTNNLFVLSSSTFPTSSQANPTFLIGVLAIRLADFLNK